MLCFFFFFNDTATTEIYPLSLHDALPILFAPSSAVLDSTAKKPLQVLAQAITAQAPAAFLIEGHTDQERGRTKLCLDRKSTRLNSSHSQISYAVFCLKKKNTHMRRC